MSKYHIGDILLVVRVKGALDMVIDIIFKIVLTVVGVLTTTATGYMIAKVKQYKEKIKDKEEEAKLQKEANMLLMQNQLTNTYFVYEQLKKIPDYVYQNWCNMARCYEKLGGNSYIHVLDEKMKSWDFEKTDILK